MATEALRAFLQQKQDAAAARNVDWFAKRDEYIAAVQKLYNLITDEYLGSPSVSDFVIFDRSQEMLVWDMQIGTYSVPKLTLLIGGEKVRFVPKGAIVVGAAGRVDVEGEAGKVGLIRELNGEWSVLLAAAPRVQMVPLDEEMFLEILQAVML